MDSRISAMTIKLNISLHTSWSWRQIWLFSRMLMRDFWSELLIMKGSARKITNTCIFTFRSSRCTLPGIWGFGGQSVSSILWNWSPSFWERWNPVVDFKKRNLKQLSNLLMGRTPCKSYRKKEIFVLLNMLCSTFYKVQTFL